MKKLLLIGPGSVHTYNFYRLIEGYFDRMRLITDRIIPGYEDIDSIKGNFIIRNPVKAWKNIRIIRQQIQSYQPDIIHIQQANSVALLTLIANRKTKIPVILTAWGSDILELSDKSFLLKKMVSYVLRNSDRFTADAVCVADKMKVLYPALAHEIVIANFGIDPFYNNTVKENIIYSNRLHQDLYRIDAVIKAFDKFIKNEHREWRLIIAGEDRETEKLKKLTTGLKLEQFVEFIGWADKELNNEMYNRAKIFVSIPKSDATAISLLEAMHAGCIPVVTDLPASHEWIKDGVNGVIVKSLEENFFERALRLDHEQVKNINRKIIEEKGLKSVNRQKFLDLYHKMLED
ncbi:MAG: glycosyltransferase family 4 protein [Bacteroidales bacterium]